MGCKFRVMSSSCTYSIIHGPAVTVLDPILQALKKDTHPIEELSSRIVGSQAKWGTSDFNLGIP